MNLYIFLVGVVVTGLVALFVTYSFIAMRLDTVARDSSVDQAGYAPKHL